MQNLARIVRIIQKLNSGEYQCLSDYYVGNYPTYQLKSESGKEIRVLCLRTDKETDT